MFDAPATPAPQDAPWRIEIEAPADASAVEALVLAAFGPGRFAKTAERLRERAMRAVGFVAWRDDRIVGSVRLWSITVSGEPALFLGPIAVSAERRSIGLGAELVARCLSYAQSKDAAGVLLIGDPPYFDRFGFKAAADVHMPGPVDYRRLLWRGERDVMGFVGVQAARRAAPCLGLAPI